MVVALTCALCFAFPDASVGAGAPLTLLHSELTLGRAELPASSAPVPLALAALSDQGAGDGHPSDHSDHMGPMWILMGAMIAVMMVGMGVYLMRHETARPARVGGATPSPAHLALPVVAIRPGGG
jgi:hypothetical protein